MKCWYFREIYEIRSEKIYSSQPAERYISNNVNMSCYSFSVLSKYTTICKMYLNPANSDVNATEMDKISSINSNIVFSDITRDYLSNQQLVKLTFRYWLHGKHIHKVIFGQNWLCVGTLVFNNVRLINNRYLRDIFDYMWVGISYNKFVIFFISFVG